MRYLAAGIGKVHIGSCRKVGSTSLQFLCDSNESVTLKTFGYDSKSIIWNSIVISITSILTIGSLIMIANSAWLFFGKRVARITSWIFVICPYTLYYAMDGGLTMYILFGISAVTYTISKSMIFNEVRGTLSYDKTIKILNELSNHEN